MPLPWPQPFRWWCSRQWRHFLLLTSPGRDLDRQGVRLKSEGTVNVKADVDADADTYIVDVAVRSSGRLYAIAILDQPF